MRTTRTLVVLLALGLIAAACSKKTATPKTPVAPPNYSIAANELGGGKYSFTLPTETMKGGVIQLTLTNSGKERHDFQLIDATPGHTLGEIVKAIGDEKAPLESWVSPPGGVGTVTAGKSSSAFFDAEPGKYFFFCTETDDKGKSHASGGMAGELTLSGESGASLPKADATVVASEYTFTVTGLKAGSNTVEFSNGGKMLHHLIGFPIKAGKTLEDVKKAIASENSNAEPPVDFEAGVGTAVIRPGVKLVTTFVLKAATSYAFMCFMPDIGTAAPPHVAKGMIVEEKIA